MNMSREITRDDLMSLEQYAEQRDEFRQQVLAHKKHRQVALGPNATLYFEDRLTLLYQIQEMLRIEKVVEADGINEELEAYKAIPVAKLKPWPFGTGLALQDWLAARRT